jgi:hypothetical protein
VKFWEVARNNTMLLKESASSDLKDVFLEGSYSGSLGADLVPLNIIV